MFSQKDIEELLELANGDNHTNSIIDFQFFEAFNKKYIINNLMSMFYEIERWDLKVDYLILSNSVKELFLNDIWNFVFPMDFSDQKGNRIMWGAKLIFSPFVPKNILVAFADTSDLDIEPYTECLGRVVCIGITDFDKIEKVLKLKAFW